MLTVACVLKSGGEYKPEHVIALKEGCSRYMPEHRFICLTDMQVGCDSVPLKHGLPGWWSKMELFGMKESPVLYLDLDTIITGDCSQIIGAASGRPLVVLRDFYRGARDAGAIGSGVMYWSADMSHILDAFLENVADNAKTPGGDQGFIEKIVDRSIVSYWQDITDGVVSFKVHVQPAGRLLGNERIVAFHGKPRPWEQKILPCGSGVKAMAEMDPYATHIEGLVEALLRNCHGPIIEMGCGNYSTPIMSAFAKRHGLEFVIASSNKEWLGRFSHYARRVINVEDWATFKLDKRYTVCLLDNEQTTEMRSKHLPHLVEMCDSLVVHDSDLVMRYPDWQKVEHRALHTYDSVRPWTTVFEDTEWRDLNNRHSGMCAYIFGRGPSLDEWHDSGAILPDGAFSIGINSVCLAMPVQYSVSADVDANQLYTPSTTWVRGIPYMTGGKDTKQSWELPKGFNLWFLHNENVEAGRLQRLKQTRDQLALSRRLYCCSSSIHPAIHFAWYLGATSVVLVGVDGMDGRCKLTESSPGRPPPGPGSYQKMLGETRKLCELIFPNAWTHWKK